MASRQIINIDTERCNGCGECVPDCPEGAIQVIDGKARLISDIFCDGLGACIGTCPQGAISTVEREAEAYDEKRTMDNIIKGGSNVVKAHLKHLKGHGQTKYLQIAMEVLREKGIPIPPLEEKLACGCPGEMARTIDPEDGEEELNDEEDENIKGKLSSNSSQLRQWPIQIHLLNPNAPYFENSHLLLLSDCVAVANPNLHSELIHGKTVAMGCPKLDDSGAYVEKLTEILKQNRIKSLTVAIMEVPCCGGMVRIAKEAIKRSGKEIPLIQETVSIQGRML